MDNNILNNRNLLFFLILSFSSGGLTISADKPTITIDNTQGSDLQQLSQESSTACLEKTEDLSLVKSSWQARNFKKALTSLQKTLKACPKSLISGSCTFAVALTGVVCFFVAKNNGPSKAKESIATPSLTQAIEEASPQAPEVPAIGESQTPEAQAREQQASAAANTSSASPTFPPLDGKTGALTVLPVSQIRIIQQACPESLEPNLSFKINPNLFNKPAKNTSRPNVDLTIICTREELQQLLGCTSKIFTDVPTGALPDSPTTSFQGVLDASLAAEVGLQEVNSCSDEHEEPEGLTPENTPSLPPRVQTQEIEAKAKQEADELEQAKEMAALRRACEFGTEVRRLARTHGERIPFGPLFEVMTTNRALKQAILNVLEAKANFEKVRHSHFGDDHTQELPKTDAELAAITSEIETATGLIAQAEEQRDNLIIEAKAAIEQANGQWTEAQHIAAARSEAQVRDVPGIIPPETKAREEGTSRDRASSAGTELGTPTPKRNNKPRSIHVFGGTVLLKP